MKINNHIALYHKPDDTTFENAVKLAKQKTGVDMNRSQAVLYILKEYLKQNGGLK